MKFVDINKRFTEIVAEYIAKGYTFNAGTMSGHQGEIAKVDLTNGEEVLRIVIDHISSSDNYWLEGLRIAVGRCTDDVTPNAGQYLQTLWTDHCEFILEECFYEINVRGREKFYGTYDEAVAAHELQRKRYEARNVSGYRSLTPTAALIRLLKQRKGFSNATRKNITVCRSKHGYDVTMAGRNGGSNHWERICFPKSK